MNIIECNSTVANDFHPPTNINVQYPHPQICQTIIDNWQDANNFHNCENQNLVAPYLRFRLASAGNHPQNNNNLYIGDHIDFMRFTRGVFNNFLRNQSCAINISPVLLIFNSNDNYYNLLYASQNYYILDTSFQIADQRSFERFFTILSTIDLTEVLAKSRLSLSSKYDNFELIVVSLLIR